MVDFTKKWIVKLGAKKKICVRYCPRNELLALKANTHFT
jgi:hypothetical protein